MKFAITVVLAAAASVLGAAVPVERALPIGHPVIDNEQLPDSDYTLRADIWPSGFQAPSATLTALPSGYSVGPTAVYGPDGSTVTAFPEDAVSAVAVVPSDEPEAPIVETSTTGPVPPSAATETPSAGFKTGQVSISSAAAVGLVAFVIASFA